MDTAPLSARQAVVVRFDGAIAISVFDDRLETAIASMKYVRDIVSRRGFTMDVEMGISQDLERGEECCRKKTPSNRAT